jgi:hypothetical protein
MPRLYIYDRGGFIRAEIAVTDSEWGQVRTGVCGPDGVLDISLNERTEVLERDELLAVSTRRRALLAWEARDDDAFEAAEKRRWLAVDVQTVREHAGLGCSEALELVAAGIPSEEARRFGAEHVCHRLRAVETRP